MATIAFQLVAGQQPLSQNAAQQGVPVSPQANAAQTAVPQSDRVTLVGRSAESQQTNQDPNGVGIGGANAYFFAERQAFRAANGSSQSQAAPKFPVEIKDEVLFTGARAQSDVAQNSVTQNSVTQNNGAENNVTQNAGQNDAAQGTADTTANAAAAASAAAAEDGPVGGTPQQELQQLDQSLRELGINPQSIALFNRMAMLLYANNPAALKAFVQQLQGTAIPSNAPTTTPNESPPAGQAQAAAPASSQSQNPPAASQTEGFSAQLTYINIQEAFQARSGQNQSQPAGEGSAAVSSDGASSSSAGTNQFSVIQLEELKFTFAALGNQGLASNTSQTPQPGQTLNVTA